jgi:hypothetical protein
MRSIARTLSWIALAATLLPSLLYLRGSLGIVQVKAWMLGATVVWFVTVPLWMDRKTP